jgi:peptidoglycan/LPS O-acetylase OafA/YrhL
MSRLYLCVDLFFILSGFVLEPAFPKRRNLKDFTSFITRRFIRLAPMLYSTLVFSLLYQAAITLKNSFGGQANQPNLDLTIKSIVFSLLFLQIFSSQAILMNYPMWSLSTEWIINLFLILPLSSKSRTQNAVTLYCLAAFFQISSLYVNYPEFVVQLSRCLAGIILGVLLRRIFEVKVVSSNSRIFIVLIIAAISGFFLLSQSNPKIAPLLCSIPFSVLIFALAKIEILKPNEIPKGLAYWAATLSFGVYAWHVPLAGIVERFTPSGMQSNVFLSFLALTAASCLMGYLVSQCFERPIQSYLKKIIGIKLG